MSDVSRRVSRMSLMSDGCGAAMQLYMVSLVIICRFGFLGGGWPFKRSGVPKSPLSDQERSIAFP